MLKILTVRVGEGNNAVWLPILVQHEHLPTAIPIIINTKYIGGLTEEAWIKQYKEHTPGAAKNDKQFLFQSLRLFSSHEYFSGPTMHTRLSG